MIRRGTRQDTDSTSGLGRHAFRVLAAIALLYAFFAGLRTIVDYDLGWQMATGRWVVEHRQIVSSDVFSFTALGQPWVYPMGSGLIFYGAYLLGGYALLSWLGAAACVSTIAVLLWRGSGLGAALGVLAVPIIAARTTPRADLFTVVLFAGFLSLLWKHHETGRAPLWALPLLMVAWVNLHLGFVAGLVLMGAYAIAEALERFFPERALAAGARLRRAIPWLLATVLATLLNPWGPGIYSALIRQERALALHQEWITEWAGVQLNWSSIAQELRPRNPDGAFWWLLAVAMVAVGCALLRRRLGAALLLSGAAWVAARHVRFQALFACIVIVVGGAAITEAYRSIGNPAKRWRQAAVACGVASVAVLAGIRSADLVSDRYYLSTTDEISTFGAGLSWWFPEKATAFIARENVPGNIYNDYNLGGYLTWRLGPRYPDYIDGRAVPFGPQLFMRAAELSAQHPDSREWLKEADQSGINSILVSLARYDGLGYFPYLREFCESQIWRPVYLDEISAVFVRRRPETQSLIDRLMVDCSVAPLPAENSQPRNLAQAFNRAANAAGVLHALGREKEALLAVDRALALFPDSGSAHHERALILGSMQRVGEAEQEYRLAVRLDPSTWTWSDVGDFYSRQRRFPEAIDALQHAADLSKHPHELLVRIGYLCLETNRPEQALQAFEQALRAGPYRALTPKQAGEFQALVAEGRARAWFQLGDVNRAAVFQQEAVGFTPNDPDRWLNLANLYRMQGRALEAQQAMSRAAALRQQH